MSGGQARRVAIARALLMKPSILIADEPTAGLDVSVQGDLLNLLQDIRRVQNITLVVISHKSGSGTADRRERRRDAGRQGGGHRRGRVSVPVAARCLYPRTAGSVAECSSFRSVWVSRRWLATLPENSTDSAVAPAGRRLRSSAPPSRPCRCRSGLVHRQIARATIWPGSALVAVTMPSSSALSSV
ncbi:ATP-binding cassette domain-containing protein [Mesorhizobium sp. B3-1-9]|nr:ATP-binding cassette domain-containing protein [Mesorhizobium sp. B3-1-9]